MTAEPRRLECTEVVENLYGYLDEELTAEVKAAVRAHISQCPDCFDHCQFERAFLRFLEARSRAQNAPPELKKRIFEQILLDRTRDA
ncbi:MAG: mycothiol system anti-sigma-R factor [Gemmatimonadetes bacterium]|nr:mycothiol system anti-sigma-R factor [Gemmatimonadota bacterium]